MGEMASLYHDRIMARGRQPRFLRPLESFDIEVREINALCGDRLTLRLRCDSAGRVAEIGCEARACIICMASADIMAELAPGMTAAIADQQAAAFDAALRASEETAWQGPLAPLEIFAPLHEAKSRIRCALLPWQGLARALHTRVSADAS